MHSKKEAGNSHSSIFLESKRGQGLSTNAIILIVLGVVILAVLILGFTIGWSKILPFISTNNVDNIATVCSVACSINGEFDFCVSGRNLKADGVTLDSITCNYLAEKQPQYGVESCQSISCNNVVLIDLGSGEKLEDKCRENIGKTIQALVGDTLQSFNCVDDI